MTDRDARTEQPSTPNRSADSATSPYVEKADQLLALHRSERILVLANIWDVASARAVAAVPGIEALATASHSIAAVFGYQDGENIPLDLHLSMVERITNDMSLPVTMDFEAGYGNPGETTRRAIAAGAVGANLEDEMKPLDDAVSAVVGVVAARDTEGTGFVLNARTDALLREKPADDHDRGVDEAIRRGRAFLDAGADCVFVPGAVRMDDIDRFVEAFGPGQLSVLQLPQSRPVRELEDHGVARVSIGPWGYRIALTALQDAATELLAGGSLPASARGDALS
jgi:2-methylisocitrate lyase-like PEP mutase family enzyme